MEWKINPGKEQCGACAYGFTAGDPYYSLLKLDEAEILRDDLCVDCFKPDEHGDAIFWRTKMVEKDLESRKIVDFGVLRELFFKMVSHEGGAFVSMAYLIGLVLIRKRYLRLVDFVTVDEKDLMRVQRRRGEPTFDVEVPLLDAGMIALLKDKLSNLLKADLTDDFDLTRLERDFEEPALSEEAGGEPAEEEPTEEETAVETP